MYLRAAFQLLRKHPWKYWKEPYNLMYSLNESYLNIWDRCSRYFSVCVINACFVFILALDFIWHLSRSKCVLADVGCITSGKLLYPFIEKKKKPEQSWSSIDKLFEWVGVFCLIPWVDWASSEPGLHVDASFDASHSCAPCPSHAEWHLSAAPCGVYSVLVF